jgi:hypothetical protein
LTRKSDRNPIAIGSGIERKFKLGNVAIELRQVQTGTPARQPVSTPANQKMIAADRG